MREQTKKAVTGSNKDAQPDDQRLFEREDALHGCTHERRSESPTKVATGSSRKIERNNKHEQKHEQWWKGCRRLLGSTTPSMRWMRYMQFL